MKMLKYAKATGESKEMDSEKIKAQERVRESETRKRNEVRDKITSRNGVWETRQRERKRDKNTIERKGLSAGCSGIIVISWLSPPGPLDDVR